MNIKNYTFIIGKKVQRSWGWEYRYTVQNDSGRNIDSIVALSTGNETDEQIAILITNQLLKIDVIPEPPIDPIEEAKQEKEDEIKDFLVSKNLITAQETIWDIQTKAEIIATAEVLK